MFFVTQLNAMRSREELKLTGFFIFCRLLGFSVEVRLLLTFLKKTKDNIGIRSQAKAISQSSIIPLVKKVFSNV